MTVSSQDAQNQTPEPVRSEAEVSEKAKRRSGAPPSGHLGNLASGLIRRDWSKRCDEYVEAMS